VKESNVCQRPTANPENPSESSDEPSNGDGATRSARGGGGVPTLGHPARRDRRGVPGVRDAEPVGSGRAHSFSAASRARLSASRISVTVLGMGGLVRRTLQLFEHGFPLRVAIAVVDPVNNWT